MKKTSRQNSKRFYQQYNSKMSQYEKNPKNRTTTLTSLGFDKIENLTGIKIA